MEQTSANSRPLVQCELNFQDCPKAFIEDHAKVTFVQSYLKGMVLEWFELDILQMEDPSLNPACVTQVDRLTLRDEGLLTLREVLTKRHCVLKEVSRLRTRDKGAGSNQISCGSQD